MSRSSPSRPNVDKDHAAAIDEAIAEVLRGGGTARLEIVSTDAWPIVHERIVYHGVAGMLAERLGSAGDVAAKVRDAARASAMWELRHRALLQGLLARFAEAGIDTRLLKGTALAYTLYSNPAWRARGDSDLLVRPEQRAVARAALAAVGFAPPGDDGGSEDIRYQETWSFVPAEGGNHSFDLHFRPFNTAALAGEDWSEAAFDDPRPLPGLGPSARAPAPGFLLFHACLHRLLHSCAPYFVGDRAYFGPDRLIWLMDIHLLAAAMGERDWATFLRLALAQRQARACREGLLAAARWLGTSSPPEVLTALRDHQAESRAYLHSGRLHRAIADFRAIGAPRDRMRYALARMFPSRSFLQSKYPAMADAPLALLHARRVAELIVPRRSAG